MKRIKQTDKVLYYIEQFGSINTLQAFTDLGITRLAAVIHRLTKKGYSFNRFIRYGNNRFGERVHYKVYSFKEIKESK